MLRELRSGKSELRRAARGGGSVFAVGKASGKQRAIGDGKRVTAAARRPPKPPHLASPAALQYFEVEEGQKAVMWKRDGKCLFDQLRLPAALRQFMARPRFAVSELIEVTGCSISEVRRYWRDAGPLKLESVVVLVGCVWAMGFGWSSWVAQCTVLDACYAAGLHESMVLAEATETPAEQTFRPSSPLPLMTSSCSARARGALGSG